MDGHSMFPFDKSFQVIQQLRKLSCRLFVRGIDFASFYDFAIGFWNFSDGEIFLFFHFIVEVHFAF
jgi:hypothetical protein